MRLSELVRLALEEDVGPGDVTTDCTVPADTTGTAAIRAKAPLVVCGHPSAAEVFTQVGATYRPLIDEGRDVQPGTVIGYHHLQHPRGVACFQADHGLGRFARPDAFIGKLATVVHRVTQKMSKRRFQPIEDVAVHLRVFTNDFQANLFPE